MIYRAKLTEVKQLETNLTHEYVKNFIEENLGIGFNEDEDEIRYESTSDYYYDGVIKIDEMIRKLNELKQDCGITHVEVLHHNDHGCYEITGFNLEVYPETDAQTAERNFEEERDRKIAELQVEIAKLQRSTYNNPTGAVEVDDDDLPF